MRDAEQYLSALTAHVLDVRGRPHRAAWLADLLGLLAVGVAALALIFVPFRDDGIIAAGIFAMTRSVVRQHPPLKKNLRLFRTAQARTLIFDLLLCFELGLHALLHTPEAGVFALVLTVTSLSAIGLLYYSLTAMLLVIGRDVLKTHPSEARLLDEMHLRQNRHWYYGPSFVMGFASVFMLIGSSVLPLMVIAIFGNWLWMQHSAFFWRSRTGFQS